MASYTLYTSTAYSYIICVCVCADDSYIGKLIMSYSCITVHSYYGVSKCQFLTRTNVLTVLL